MCGIVSRIIAMFAFALRCNKNIGTMKIGKLFEGMLLLASLVCILNLVACAGDSLEEDAKKQLRKSLKEVALNPKSIDFIEQETAYCDENVCVIKFVIRGQNEMGGNSINKYEYIYLKGKGDKPVRTESFRDLEEYQSIIDETIETREEVRSKGGKETSFKESIFFTASLKNAFNGREVK